MAAASVWATMYKLQARALEAIDSGPRVSDTMRDLQHRNVLNRDAPPRLRPECLT